MVLIEVFFFTLMSRTFIFWRVC